MGIAEFLAAASAAAMLATAGAAVAGGPDKAAEPVSTAAAPATAPVSADTAQAPVPASPDSGAAASADVAVGTPVVDKDGQAIGTVESVDGDLATVAAGETRVRIPLNAFAKSDKGAMLGMTKAEFDAAAKSAQPS